MTTHVSSFPNARSAITHGFLIGLLPAVPPATHYVPLVPHPSPIGRLGPSRSDGDPPAQPTP